MKAKPELIVGKLLERCDQLHELLNKIIVADDTASDHEDFLDQMEPLLLEAREFLEAEAKRKAHGVV